MYILASNMWFQKLMIQFFFSIDKIVFNFISSVYDLLLTIARTSILTQADIADMADRIYKLLAIFMVFKVTLSLITYVVNPDDFSDKSKGLSKLGTNSIIVLALLILTPYLFNYAYQLQTIVVEDNAIAALIFGDESGNDENSFFNSAGDSMAYTTMSAFYSPNLSLGDLHTCSSLMTRTDVDDYVFDPECETAMTALATGNDNFDEAWLKNYIAGVENNNLGLMFRQDMALATNKENTDFIMNYKFIFSTVMGVVVILLLITFCMDIAVRSIKLALLQLIAPIPIISYIDPKSGKDGLFKKWYDMCFKTYISLFIRLLALYFAVYIIGKVASFKMVDLVDGSYQTNGFVAIFIIVGALIFAKQLPKMLEGLGLKLDGNFTLNPLRKVEKEALGGGLLKKPNDLLAKGAKGLLKSPINGVGTFGKKMIGGVDAARNGKGFKQGFNRTHGKLHNNFYKKLDEWAPDSAEARKNERLGREEVKSMNNKWTSGKKTADRLNQKYGKDPFKLFDGNNRDPYEDAYSNKQFIESRMNLDKADNKRKILQRISDATMRGDSLEDALAYEANNIKKLDPKSAESFEKIKNNTQLAEALDNTTKAVSGMEKVHESIRKQNRTDAETEDALKFVKYNRTDPTDPSRKVEYSTSSSESTTYDASSHTSNTSGAPNSGIVFDDSVNYSSKREQQSRDIQEEIDRNIEEINKQFDESINIDREVSNKLKNLKDELEKLVYEKASARDQQDRDEIDEAITRKKEEIQELIGK